MPPIGRTSKREQDTSTRVKLTRLDLTSTGDTHRPRLALLSTPTRMPIALPIRRHAMSAVLAGIETACTLAVRVVHAGKLVLVRRRGVVAVGRVVGTVGLLDVSDGALFLPSTCLVSIRIDPCSPWCTGTAVVAPFGASWRCVDSFDGALRAGGLSHVAVPLQDLLGSDVFILVEEGRVIEERLEILRYL